MNKRCNACPYESPITFSSRTWVSNLWLSVMLMSVIIGGFLATLKV